MATALSESEAKSVFEADRKFHLHSFSVPKDLHLGPKDTFVSADNIYLYYADGTRVIDGLSGLGCVNVGYGRREIADAAHEALIALPYGLTIGRVTHPYAARLAEKVVEKLPSAYSRVFFASSGSEAVESAVKLARYFWHVQDKPKKKKIVSRTRAYHGGTLFTAALSDLPGMHEAFGLPLDNDVERISSPFPYYRDEGESPEAYGVPDRSGARDQDQGSRRRQHCRVHRRALALRRGLHRTASGLLAGDPQDLQRARRAADRRRGGLWLWQNR